MGSRQSTMATDGVEKKDLRLYHAMELHNWQEVESLLNSEGRTLNMHHPEHEWGTYLHYAAFSDPPAYILQQLLEIVDIAFCSQPNEYGETPLSLICDHGTDLDAIRLLVRERPQELQVLDRHGSSPLDHLMDRVREGQLDEADVAQIIADAAEAWPDGMLHVNNFGETLLQRAIPCSFLVNDFILLRTILAIQPKLIEVTDFEGNSAIHFAVSEGHKDAGERLKLLLECGGSHGLGVKDSEGRTPLHKACYCHVSSDVIATLVAHHPSALNIRDTFGRTPLESFRRHNRSFLTCRDFAKFVTTWRDNKAEIAMTLLSRVPVRCSDAPSLHDLLRNAECTSDIARLLTHALKDQTSLEDSNGDLPLHIVASMYSDDDITYRKLVQSLLGLYPAACQVSNREGTLPLELMDHSGKSWSNGMRMVLLQHPAAVLDLELNHFAMCALLEKVGSEEEPDALFRMLKDAPTLLQEYRRA